LTIEDVENIDFNNNKFYRNKKKEEYGENGADSCTKNLASIAT
jgi:hypothetical protein